MTAEAWVGRSRRLVSFALVTAAAAATWAVGAEAASAAPRFPQCPPVGNNQGCSQLIVAKSDGTVVVLTDPAAPPRGYDGAEDTLIGFQNNSGHSFNSVSLASPNQPIFAFDNDGICNPPQWPSAPPVTPSNCPGPQGFGPSGYEGPNNFFQRISANDLSGQVVFRTPINSGHSTYFALEEALQAGQLLSGQGGHPATTPPRVFKTTVSFQLGCVFGNRPCRGKAQLILIRRGRGNVVRRIVVGSVNVFLRAGQTKTVFVSLNKTGLNLLRTVPNLRALVQVALRNARGHFVLTRVGKVKFKRHKHR
jgi:hypothetical protein